MRYLFDRGGDWDGRRAPPWPIAACERLQGVPSEWPAKSQPTLVTWRRPEWKLKNKPGIYWRNLIWDAPSSGDLVPNHAIPHFGSPLSRRTFYYLSLPFSHSNALFLCRRSVLWRPNFTPIKPPTTKASAAISNHSIVPPVLLSFDNGRCKYRTAIFKYFKLNHYTSISKTGAAERIGLPKVSIATDKTDKILV